MKSSVNAKTGMQSIERAETKPAVHSKLLKLLIALLLVLAWNVSSPGQAQKADAADKKVYEVTWATEDLATPMNWVQSRYFNNPQYKETRFENYGGTTPIPPGGVRETSFYMVYKEDGLYMFMQSNEEESDADGKLKPSSLEFYVQTGEGDLPYHQVIVPTDGENLEYYEWQTEYRHNRPFQGNIRVYSAQIPSGWGTVVVIPWEAVYDSIPLNGENWGFNMIRWFPTVSPTWGGNVHQPGRFNQLHFQPPTAEQRMEIQKHVLTEAWDSFQAKSAELGGYWLTNAATREPAFYSRYVLPLIVDGTANGAWMNRLESLNAAQLDKLYGHVDEWMELRYDVDDRRRQYVKRLLLGQEVMSAGAPGKPVLSGDNGHDTGLLDGNFNIRMDMWWGNNGTVYKLYENDALIDTRVLADHSPNAQSTVTAVTYKPNGVYRYYAELVNDAGTTRSDVLTVNVTQAAPGKPVLSHNNWDGDGSFAITMNMWWGVNGAEYRLYENGVLIDTQALTQATPQAQSAVTTIAQKPAGTYEYIAELVNYAGAVSSAKITVAVTRP